MKKLVALLVVAVLVFGAVIGCAKAPATGDAGDTGGAKKKIGISMPTQSLQRWNQDGSNMKSAFEDAGYDVDLQYAGDNDVPTQIANIENMVSSKCDVLVIAAIEGDSLTAPLQAAKDAGIPVISYDRLIMNSDAVSYYATFDNTKVGNLQGQFIADALKLDSEKGPFNIELFTGDPADNNVNFFWGGALDILQPYIDSGVLKVPSGQVTKDQCATVNWNTEESQKRMENLISSNGYGPKGTKLDAVLSSNDSVANGITNALVAAGYKGGPDFPVLTGQDCDKTSVQNMLADTQSMSVFKDTRTLADRVVKMVTAIVDGTEVEVNDETTYNNGTGIIPSYLEDPFTVVKDDIQKVLIDSGYYQPADIGL